MIEIRKKNICKHTNRYPQEKKAKKEYHPNRFNRKASYTVYGKINHLY